MCPPSPPPLDDPRPRERFERALFRFVLLREGVAYSVTVHTLMLSRLVLGLDCFKYSDKIQQTSLRPGSNLTQERVNSGFVGSQWISVCDRNKGVL